MFMPKISYRGWPNCFRLANDLVDLVMTTDVGPRIIRFGFRDDENRFKEFDAMMGKRGGNQWRIYGGHRLWHAPEHPVRTYSPDNRPVKLQQLDGITRLIQPVEPTTGIQKEMDVALAPDKPSVCVTHRLRNTNPWPVEMAPWALTVMTTETRAIIPMPPRGKHPQDLLPANTLTIWPYTNMGDPRWHWSEKYITLQQIPGAANPQKFGASLADNWIAGYCHSQLFVKRFSHTPKMTYPDCNCHIEVFTNDEMIELETLGPLTKLEPGATIEHIEYWYLYRDVPDVHADAELDRHILPLARRSKPWKS